MECLRKLDCNGEKCCAPTPRNYFKQRWQGSKTGVGETNWRSLVVLVRIIDKEDWSSHR